MATLQFANELLSFCSSWPKLRILFHLFTVMFSHVLSGSRICRVIAAESNLRYYTIYYVAVSIGYASFISRYDDLFE